MKYLYDPSGAGCRTFWVLPPGRLALASGHLYYLWLSRSKYIQCHPTRRPNEGFMNCGLLYTHKTASHQPPARILRIGSRRQDHTHQRVTRVDPGLTK
jgi:hypothetical protein